MLRNPVARQLWPGGAIGTHRRWKRTLGKYTIFYALVLPAVLLRGVYTVGPLVHTFIMSLSDKSIARPGSFIGLENYVDLVRDRNLHETLSFTAFYASSTTVLQVLAGLGIALLLNQNLRGQWMTRVAILLPWGTAGIVGGIMWKLIFVESGGVANDIVLRFNLAPSRVLWLSDPNLAKLSVIIASVWKGSPWVALLLLAGLKSIPQEVYEAAEVDGAGVWGRFIFITMPLLVPMMLVVLMLNCMGEINAFGEIVGLTNGGPGSATRVISLLVAERFFKDSQYGYGSALVLVLMLLTVLIGGVFAFLLSKQERR